MSNSRTIIELKSSDGEILEVEESVAMESGFIRHIIQYRCDNSPISLLEVTSKILGLVLKYCRKHTEAMNADEDEMHDLFSSIATKCGYENNLLTSPIVHKDKDMIAYSIVVAYAVASENKAKLYFEETLEGWDAEFVEKLDLDTLKALIKAAMYLDIKGLVHLTAQKIEDILNDKIKKEMRRFNWTVSTRS